MNNNKELASKLLAASNKLHLKQLQHKGSANTLIVSQKWVDETCKNWGCTEEELKDFFSGKTPFHTD